MIKLTAFTTADFDKLIGWIDNPALLVTIAGNVFTYPLTHLQLESYLAIHDSHAFNIEDETNENIIGHAELLLSGSDMYKIDKLIIGDSSNRGKGIGQQTIKALLDYAFDILKASVVELNVFDWNIAAIKCYEKCGFAITPGKQIFFKVDDRNWLALNLTIDKQKYLQKLSN